jgi:hypothetical protein
LLGRALVLYRRSNKPHYAFFGAKRLSHACVFDTHTGHSIDVYRPIEKSVLSRHTNFSAHSRFIWQ